jgi:hypothetical protein
MGSHCRPAAWVNSFGVEFFSPGGGSGCCSEDETLEEAERKMGSRENGKPRRAGGGASQQLPTSPNTGTPARSQSGISHPCDQNVETTLRNTQYFVLPGLGAWKNFESHSDDQDTATQLVGS